jgi:hypothetical protein
MTSGQLSRPTMNTSLTAGRRDLSSLRWSSRCRTLEHAHPLGLLATREGRPLPPTMPLPTALTPPTTRLAAPDPARSTIDVDASSASSGSSGKLYTPGPRLRRWRRTVSCPGRFDQASRAKASRGSCCPRDPAR